MPNHYTNVLYVFDGHRDEFEGRDMVADLVARKWADQPLNRATPMPAELEGTTSPAPVSRPDLVEKYGADNWYDWQILHRGIKWDAYQALTPVQVPGDCWAVQLTFCTAWGPPNEATCAAVARELFDEYGADKVVWIGLDPYDCTFKHVGEWEWEAPEPGLRLVSPSVSP